MRSRDLKALKNKKKKLEKEIEEEKKKSTYSSREERKKRTRNLIQKGALLEKYCDLKDVSVEETEEILKSIAPLIKIKRGNF